MTERRDPAVKGLIAAIALAIVLTAASYGTEAEETPSQEAEKEAAAPANSAAQFMRLLAEDASASTPPPVVMAVKLDEETMAGLESGLDLSEIGPEKPGESAGRLLLRTMNAEIPDRDMTPWTCKSGC